MTHSIYVMMESINWKLKQPSRNLQATFDAFSSLRSIMYRGWCWGRCHLFVPFLPIFSTSYEKTSCSCQWITPIIWTWNRWLLQTALKTWSLNLNGLNLLKQLLSSFLKKATTWKQFQPHNQWIDWKKNLYRKMWLRVSTVKIWTASFCIIQFGNRKQ